MMVMVFCVSFFFFFNQFSWTKSEICLYHHVWFLMAQGFPTLFLFQSLASRGHPSDCVAYWLVRGGIQSPSVILLSAWFCGWDGEHTHSLGLRVCYSFYFLLGFLTYPLMCGQRYVDGLGSRWFLVCIKRPVNPGYLESLSSSL